MEIIQVTSQDQRVYDFLKNQPNGTLFQTPQWGQVKSGPDWTHQTLLFVDERGQSQALAMVLFRKLPLIPYSLAYAPRGIVTDFANKDQLSQIIKLLKAYLKKAGAFSFKMDPEQEWHQWTNDYQLVEGGFDHSALRQNLLDLGFKNQPLDLGFDGVQPRMTMIVDLEDKGKGILDTFNAKERYKVTTASNRGVVCYKGTLEEMDAYEILNQITAQRDQYIARSQAYLTKLYTSLKEWDMVDLYFAKLDYQKALDMTQARIQAGQAEIAKLQEQLDSTQNEKKKANLQKQVDQFEKNLEKYQVDLGQYQALLQEHPQGVYLSGAIVAYFGDTAYYLYGANVTDDGGLHANKALQAFIMQDLYDRKGVRKYDMYGVSTNLEEHTGITRFKQSFDPRLVEYIGEFDLPIRPFWHQVFQEWAPKLMKLRAKRLRDKR